MTLTLPRDDLKKQEALEKVADNFEKEKNYGEMQVSKIIKECDVDDYVLFRRELVNFGYLGKDSHNDKYWLKKKILSKEDLKNIGITQDKIREN